MNLNLGTYRGGDGIRTRVDGFAGRCLASRPRHRLWVPHLCPQAGCLSITRADDEIRTRDPHLGKVMRYHCATSAYIYFCARISACLETVTDREHAQQIQRGSRVSPSRTVHDCVSRYFLDYYRDSQLFLAATAALGDWRSW